MMPTLSQTLRSQRHRLGKDLKAIAAESGISQSQLSHLELGRMARPRPGTLERIASAYDIPFESLMLLAGYLPKPDPTVELPEFIKQAGRVLNIEDWEPLREIVTNLVAAKTIGQGKP